MRFCCFLFAVLVLSLRGFRRQMQCVNATTQKIKQEIFCGLFWENLLLIDICGIHLILVYTIVSLSLRVSLWQSFCEKLGSEYPSWGLVRDYIILYVVKKGKKECTIIDSVFYSYSCFINALALSIKNENSHATYYYPTNNNLTTEVENWV